MSKSKRVGGPRDAGSILATGWVMAFDAEFQSLQIVWGCWVRRGDIGSDGKMVEPRWILEMLYYCRNYLYLLEKNVREGDEASHLIATVMKYQRNVSRPEK